LNFQPTVGKNQWFRTFRTKNDSLGVSNTDIPLQGASTSSIPAVGGLGHLISEVGGLHLAKKALSGCARRKLKKAKAEARKAGTGSNQQPGNADSSKQGENPTGTFKRTRSESTTPIETARTPKTPRDSKRPGGSAQYKGSYLQGNLS
jgi:hypothetical protein